LTGKGEVSLWEVRKSICPLFKGTVWMYGTLLWDRQLAGGESGAQDQRRGQ